MREMTSLSRSRWRAGWARLAAAIVLDSGMVYTTYIGRPTVGGPSVPTSVSCGWGTCQGVQYNIAAKTAEVTP